MRRSGATGASVTACEQPPGGPSMCRRCRSVLAACHATHCCSRQLHHLPKTRLTPSRAPARRNSGGVHVRLARLKLTRPEDSPDLTGGRRAALAPSTAEGSLAKGWLATHRHKGEELLSRVGSVHEGLAREGGHGGTQSKAPALRCRRFGAIRRAEWQRREHLPLLSNALLETTAALGLILREARREVVRVLRDADGGEAQGRQLVPEQKKACEALCSCVTRRLKALGGAANGASALSAARRLP